MAEIKILLDAFTQEKSLDSAIPKLEKVLDLTERIKANKGALADSKSITDTAKLTVETEKLARAKEKEVKADRSLTIYGQMEKIQRQEMLKTLKQEAREQLGLVSLYEKLSIKHVNLSKSYKDLALAGRENGKVAKGLKIEIDELDKSLKKVDADTGKFVRNVGNYASGFNGLQTSIDQVTREFPNFINNARIGFLAISNNLPILADNIARIRKQNAELIAQGLPVESVLSQITKAFFAWGTALSVGITLLTAFGDDLVNAVSNIFSFNEALFKLQKRQETFNKIFEDNTKYFKAQAERSKQFGELGVEIAEAQFKTEREIYELRKKNLASEQLKLIQIIEKNNQKLDNLAHEKSRQETDDAKKATQDKIDALQDEQDNLIAETKQFNLKDAKLDADYNEIKRQASIKNAERKIQLERQIGIEIRDDRIKQINEETKILIAEENLRYKEEIRIAKINGENLEILEKEHHKKILKIQEDAFKEALQEAENQSNEELRKNKIDFEKKKKQEQGDRNAIHNLAILNTKENSYRRLKVDIAIAEEERDILLKNAHLTEFQRREIIRQSEEDIRKIKQNYIAKQVEDIQRIGNLAFAEIQREADARKEVLNQQVSDQDIAIKRQQELADKGLANTLAFEERRKAELRRSQEEERKRTERLKEIEAFFNLFANYAKQDATTALPKAIRDIALAKAFAAAFAEDGGIVEDIAQPVEGGRIVKGIFKGRSHKQGGIHLEAEGEEGIFSVKEMRNIGRDNFYALKNLAKTPIDNELFARQNAAFIQQIPIMIDKSQDELIEEIRDLKFIIKNKEEFNYKGFTKDMKYFITETKRNGARNITKHKIRSF